jgi:hypothetical protein
MRRMPRCLLLLSATGRAVLAMTRDGPASRPADIRTVTMGSGRRTRDACDRNSVLGHFPLPTNTNAKADTRPPLALGESPVRLRGCPLGAPEVFATSGAQSFSYPGLRQQDARVCLVQLST